MATERLPGGIMGIFSALQHCESEPTHINYETAKAALCLEREDKELHNTIATEK